MRGTESTKSRKTMGEVVCNEGLAFGSLNYLFLIEIVVNKLVSVAITVEHLSSYHIEINKNVYGDINNIIFLIIFS